MNNGRIILIMARYISMLFTPFYLPVVSLIVLFIVSYFSILPLMYKVTVLALVWLFTCLMPTLLIYLYRRTQGWSLMRMLSKEGRIIPYIISIACYFACFYIMNLLHMPHFMSSIVVAALAIQIIGAIINNWWKISTHTAAIGGTTGAIMAFSLIFNFNPIWWLCLLIILAGIIGTGRMILRIHTLGEICGGYLLGLAAGFIAVILS